MEQNYSFIKSDTCKDIGGLPLRVGDKVMPCFIGFEGTISQIYYCKELNESFVDIVDDNGKILLDKAISTDYTTAERFMEAEYGDYIYSLNAYDKNYRPLISLCILSNRTEKLELPDNTDSIEIRAEHLSSHNKGGNTYISGSIFILALKTAELCLSDEGAYLRNKETYKFINWVYDNNYRLFDTKEELENYVNQLITYFNEADLTDINNSIEFHKNEKAQTFEKTLIKRLKTQ